MSNAAEFKPTMSGTTTTAKTPAPMPTKPRQRTNRLTTFKWVRSDVDLYIKQAMSILGEDKATRFRVFSDLEERKTAVRKFIANKRCKLLGDTFSAFSLLRPDGWDVHFPDLAKLCPSGLLTIVALGHETRYASKAAALHSIQASNNATSDQVQDPSTTFTSDEKSPNPPFTAQEAPTIVKVDPVYDDIESAQVKFPGSSLVDLEQVATLEHPLVANSKRRAAEMSFQDRTKPHSDGVLEPAKKWRREC